LAVAKLWPVQRILAEIDPGLSVGELVAERLQDQAGTAAAGLGAYVSRICSAPNMLDWLHTVALNISAERMDAPVNNASQIGLLVSELLTNSLQHGFTETEGGTINVSLAIDPATGEVLLGVEDDGRGLPEGSKWPQEGNLGARIVRDLAARLGAKLIVDNADPRLSVTLRLPASTLKEEA